ncbi:MAG: MerR family transcriptional regulator [Pyrinomonadaceae bacterium]
MTAIPEKLYFKIGEVCEIVGVQAHVLRYWETEFSMLTPQKNRAGQRTYRRRDVEMALRIKELLYEEQYTIAGAKKRLASETRGPSKLKVVSSEPTAPAASSQRSQPRKEERAAPATRERTREFPSTAPVKDDKRAPLQQIADQLREILLLLDNGDADLKSFRR